MHSKRLRFPWHSTCVNVMTYRFRGHCLSSSNCSRMRLPAQPILSAHAGVALSFALHVVALRPLIGLPIVQQFFGAAFANTTPTLLLAPSWSAPIRHFPFGSGPLTW